jgi:hypothetical protein
MSKELSRITNGAASVGEAQSYPGESVLVWKSLSKPALAGNAARAVQQCAVSKRPGSDTPGGVSLAQIVVRASTAKAKHETCLCGLPESLIRLVSPSYSGAWRCHLEIMALYLYR